MNTKLRGSISTKLCPREREVYELIIREGLSCKEMAVRLGIATNTLNIYVKRILSKRKAESRLRLVVKHYMEAKAA